TWCCWPRPPHRWTSSEIMPTAASGSHRRYANSWEMRQMTTSRPPRQPPRSTEDSSRPGADARGRQSPGAVIAVKKLFAAETGNYFLLLGTTLFLIAFGLVMVLSSSAVTSYTETDDFFRGVE